MEKELIGFNVYWLKNGSTEEKVTFIMSVDHTEAYNKVLRIKGGPSKVTITKVQEYDRLNKTLVGSPIVY